MTRRYSILGTLVLVSLAALITLGTLCRTECLVVPSPAADSGAVDCHAPTPDSPSPISMDCCERGFGIPLAKAQPEASVASLGTNPSALARDVRPEGSWPSTRVVVEGPARAGASFRQRSPILRI